MLVLLGSSSFESASAPLVRALARELEVRAAGVRGRSLRGWLSEPLPVVRGLDVLVYLPGNGVASVAHVLALHSRILNAGARSVRWALPPRWPDVAAAARAEREANARAVSIAGVPLFSPARPLLTSEDLSGDLVHLDASGGERVAAAWLRGVSTREKIGGLLPLLVVGCLLARWAGLV